MVVNISLPTSFPSGYKEDVRIRRDDTDAISRLYACLYQGVRKILDPLSPKSASLKMIMRWPRIDGIWKDAPDSKCITDWVFHVHMNECDLVRIDLRCAKNECQWGLSDAVQPVLYQ